MSMEVEPQVSRVTRSKDQARALYDGLSGWYDLFGGAEIKLVRQGVRQLAVQPGDRVLEIGFGTGIALIELARTADENGQVYGIDLSAGMQRVASARLRRAHLLDKVELAVGDAVRLPYPTDFFDALFSSFTLELFDTPEIPLVLRECYRVLAPSGRAVLVSMDAVARPGAMIRLYERLHAAFGSVVDCRPIPVRASLQQAGFTIRDAWERSVYGLPVAVVLAAKPAAAASGV